MTEFVKVVKTIKEFEAPKRPVLVVPAGMVKKVQALPEQSKEAFKRNCNTPQSRDCTGPDWFKSSLNKLWPQQQAIDTTQPVKVSA